MFIPVFRETTSKIKPAPKKRGGGVKRTRRHRDNESAKASLLESDTEDENEARRAVSRNRGRLTSSFERRVADGILKRTTTLPGSVFVELRVYNTADIIGLDIKERWKKSTLMLKHQTSHDAPETELLKKYVNCVKAQFEGEGKFYPNKSM